MLGKIKAFFLWSETIFVARVQAFAGVVLGVFLTLDPGLFEGYVPPKWLPIYLLVIGVVTEYARRRGATDLGKGQ